MLAKVKLALRITHTLLDSDIEETIALARAEMVRAGVNSSVADSNLPIVEGAIKTYCLYRYANDEKMSEGYFKSWEYQIDNLRKSNIVVPIEDLED